MFTDVVTSSDYIMSMEEGISGYGALVENTDRGNPNHSEKTLTNAV
jgi:hypothetical protein